jgi:hypothetical protein
MKVKFLSRLVLMVAIVAAGAGLRAQVAPASPTAPATATSAPAASPPVDKTQLVSECQRTLNADGYIGLIWWIPNQFWEIANAQNPQGGKMVATALAPYTVIAMAVGREHENGILPEWISEDDLRAHATIEDASGFDYPPLPSGSVSDEAQTVVGVMRPVFSKLLGSMGENIHFVFFPINGKDGQPLADPTKQGQFSVVLKDILGPGKHPYLYRLPLTALSPPRFCPVGGERVEADWIYCPWHGVRLDSAPAAAPAEKKAEEPPAHPQQ